MMLRGLKGSLVEMGFIQDMSSLLLCFRGDLLRNDDFEWEEVTVLI